MYMQKTFTDQLGRSITFTYPAKRIVSLVPSQTELLFELGLSEEIVGITKFCIHPEAKVKGKQKVGGTKKLNLEQIRSLQPDLIIGNKEENTKEDIDLLSKEFPVWMSDITNLEEGMEAITAIADLVDREPEAAYLNHLIEAGFRDLQTLALQLGINKKVLYLIWKDPYMAAGRGTYINDVLCKIGLTNVLKDERYPELSLAQLEEIEPDIVFLSSEPYPFMEKHLEVLKVLYPAAQVMLVDGEFFSWHGSRMVKAVQYLFQLQPQLN